MNFFLTIVTLLLNQQQVKAQTGTLGRWEMCGLTTTPAASRTATGVAANVTFSTLTRGSGITAAGQNNTFASTGWSTAASVNTSDNDYYQFTITPAAGNRVSITSLRLRDIATSAVGTACLRYSLDNFTSNLSSWTPATTNTNRSIPLSANTLLQGRINEAVTFRIYRTGASSASDAYNIHCQGTSGSNYRGIDIDGSVSPILGSWPFCGITGTTSGGVAASGVASNITFSELSRGAGITASAQENGYGSTGWSTASTLNLADNDYYEFTLTPAAGHRLSVSSLRLRDSSSIGTGLAYLRYSVDNYASNLSSWTPSTTGTNRPITLSGNANLQNRFKPVTFRVYFTKSNSASDIYNLVCQGSTATAYGGVDIDGTVIATPYAAEYLSMSYGSGSWCQGELRNVEVTIKNIGTATWVDGTSSTTDINIGAGWGTGWSDKWARVNAGNLAPGETRTYTIPIAAAMIANLSSFTPRWDGSAQEYSTPLATGNNTLVFDIVNEATCWFTTCNPGNTVYTSPTISITATPITNKTVAAQSASICTGTSTNITVAGTSVNETYQLRNNANNALVGTAVTGTGGTISFPTGNLTATTTYNVLVTTTAATGSCPNTRVLNTTPTVTIVTGPTATAGAAQSVCQTSATVTVSGFTAANGTISWTENGAGSITSGGTTTAPVYTTAAGDYGNTVSLTMTVTSNNACSTLYTPVTVNHTINIRANPTASAGGSQTICANRTALISGASASNGTIAWTENGSGSITAGSTTLTPTYTPALGDTGTTRTMTMTVSNSPCVAATATYSVVINKIPWNKTVAASASAVCPSGSTNITVANSLASETYQLRNNTGNVSIGSAVTGTGGTISLPTGTLTAGTTFNVLATNTTTGCSAQMTTTPAVTINALPAERTITAASAVCIGSSTNIVVATSVSGTTYQLRNNANNSNIGTAVSGNGGSINLPTGNLTNATTFNILATITATGCIAQMTTTPSISINALPLERTVASAVTAVCNGSSTNITVDASESGINYQLRNNTGNTNIGTAVAGSGGTINLNSGNLTTATTFNVRATHATTGCTLVMSELPAITTINPLPTNKTTGRAAAAVCSGSGTNITVANSLSTETYQLRNNTGNTLIGSALAGNTGTLNLPTGNLTSGITFNVLATITATGCSAQMTTTQAVSINPLPVNQTLTATASALCTGSSTSINIGSSVSGTTYQLRNNATNTNIGTASSGTGSGISISTGTLTASTTFNVLATITATGCNTTMTALPSVRVDAASPQAAGVITGGNAVCARQSNITYSIDAVATAANYTWTVPSGWSITGGQGTNSITVTAGNTGGIVTVVPDNACGSNSLSLSSDISPVNSAGSHNTGYTDNSSKFSGEISINSASRKGYLVFPLSGIPANATITGSTLKITQSSTSASGGNYAVTQVGSSVNTANDNAASLWTSLGSYAGTISGDITGLGGTLTARGENLPSEGRNKVIDNNTSTKWLDFGVSGDATGSASDLKPSWLQWAATNASTVTSYTLTSANDAPERDPKNWTLLGSNDGGTTWTTVDTRSNETFASRLLKKTYTTTNTQAFSTYRLNISSVNTPASANSVQLAELELLATGGAIPYANTGTLTTGLNTFNLNSFANTDIQNRLSSPGFLAMGLTGGAATTYNFWGMAGSDGNGLNAPVLTVNYTMPRSMMISVNDTPSLSGNIAGTASICAGISGNSFSIGNAANTDNYTWTLPNGWSITGGENSNSITVTSGIQSGNISVTANNGCGSSSARTFAVTVPANSWSGAANSSWNNAANWSCGVVPVSGSDVIISSSATNLPNLDADVTLGGLEIAEEKTFDINGNTVTINGPVSGPGSITGSHTSNLVLNGNAGALRFTQSGTGNFLKNLTLGNGAIASLSNPLNITAGTTANAEGTLTVGGSAVLTTNDNLTIKSNSFGTARIAPNTTSSNYISGNVTVERFIPKNTYKAWRLMAVNTTGQTINQAWQEGQSNSAHNNTPGFGTMITGPGGSNEAAQALGFDQRSVGYSLFYYDSQNDNLLGVPNTNNTQLNDYSGYFLFIRGDRSPGQFGSNTMAATSTTLRSKGNLIMGTQAAVTVNPGKFALVSNPYPSAIDMRTVLATRTNGDVISNSFQVWDPKLAGGYGLGAYQTYYFDPTTGNYDVTPGGGSLESAEPADLNYVQSGAAFFIQNSGEAAGSITISENAKAGGSMNMFRPTGNGSNMKLKTTLHALTATGLQLADGNTVRFGDEFDNAINTEDVIKSGNFGENFGLLRNGKELAVEARQLPAISDTVFFKMYSLKRISYRLHFTPVNMPADVNAFLEDAYTNTSVPVNLNDTSAYTFTVSADAASAAQSRFRIVFRPLTPLPVTVTEVRATALNNRVAVEWTVSNQVNLREYRVERSADGRNFSAIGTVAARNTAAASTAYRFDDAQTLNGWNYYRIRCVDNDGRFKYTNIVKVMTGKAGGSISVYPNPVEGNTMNLQLVNQAAGRYNLRLVSTDGKTILSQAIDHNGGSAIRQVELPQHTTSGTYQLEVFEGQERISVQQLMIQNK